MTSIVEATYPISFRKNLAQKLGNHLKNRHCVNLIGMRRVGISNFLRFFLNHKKIYGSYISDGFKHLFIAVDLNDLVEREIYPFWVLTLKRIVDTAQKHSLPKILLDTLENIFLDWLKPGHI